MMQKPITYYSDFDINLSKNSLTNDIIKKTNSESIKQSLKLLFLYNYYDKLWNPSVGSYLKNFIFRPADNYSIILIKEEIENLILNYEPRISINNLNVYFNENTTDNGYINIVLDYTILNLNVNDTFYFTFNRVR